MDQRTMEAAERINLEPIMVKLMDQKDGEGWTLERAQKVAQEYRRFLALCRKYPDCSIVPYGDLDTFWHYHILDTAKYAADCDDFFGYFLHHFPYLGMRGPEDAEQLKRDFAETRRLFEEEFGVAYGATTDATSCSGSPCGNRCTNKITAGADDSLETARQLTDLERPQLASIL